MEIRTERLLLRDFTDDDWAAVLAYHLDPRFPLLHGITDATEESARAFLRPFLEWQREEPRRMINLAITLAATGELIGITGVRQRQPGQPLGDIGYELAPWHWGRGYATEAARAMLAVGFERLGLHKVYARCAAGNAASARVLERLGMRLEARLRQHEWIRGEPHDELLFGILAEEWRSRP